MSLQDSFNQNDGVLNAMGRMPPTAYHLMKRKLLLLPILAALLVSSGCSRKPVEITGQIFVVTAGRENVKMGLTPVHVVSDEEFKKIAASLSRKIREDVTKESQSGMDGDARTAFIRETLGMESPDLDVPELPALRKEAVGDAAGKLLKRLEDGSMTFEKGMRELIGAMPPAVIKTDADGRFSVSIRSKSWIVAYGQRSVGKDNDELYLWISPCELPKGEAVAPLLISNDCDYDTLDGLYAMLSTEAGKPDELERHLAKEVSPSFVKWIEEAKVRREAAIVAAKLKAAEARIAAEKKAENERAEAEARAERERAAIRAKIAGGFGAGVVGKAFEFPLPGNIPISFTYCPAGSFMMGSPESEDGRSSDEDQVSVQISKGFWLAKTELTQAQWRTVMGDSPSHFKGDRLPVENVSWDDSQRFIAKLNEWDLAPQGWKFALPTEAQWEYACRAGETGDYAGGLIDEVAWYSSNSESKTHEVGTKKPNVWGLHDMHGNVWEWCADWYASDLQGRVDPQGPSSGDYRVLRGGSWSNFAARCRAAPRYRYNPANRNINLGFRPALVPSE